MTNSRIRKESMYGQVVGQYNEYGTQLRNGFSMRDLAEKLNSIAEFAEQTLTNETASGGKDDWFDQHTIRRNVKEMRSYVKEFSKLAEDSDSIKSRATALYDDMGRVLERYFEVTGYDADDDQTDELVPGNSQKDPLDNNLQPAIQSHNVVHEDGVEGDDERTARNKDIQQRLLALARKHLTGEQLSRFDTLPEGKQLRVAWRVVR